MQMITNEKIDAETLSRIYFMIIVILVFFTQMFLYCFAGELITKQVSNNFIHFNKLLLVFYH